MAQPGRFCFLPLPQTVHVLRERLGVRHVWPRVTQQPSNRHPKDPNPCPLTRGRCRVAQARPFTFTGVERPHGASSPPEQVGTRRLTHTRCASRLRSARVPGAGAACSRGPAFLTPNPPLPSGLRSPRGPGRLAAHTRSLLRLACFLPPVTFRSLKVINLCQRQGFAISFSRKRAPHKGRTVRAVRANRKSGS